MISKVSLMLLLAATSLAIFPSWSFQAESRGAAIDNLAEAISYRTISYEDRDKIDYQDFVRFREFLKRAYPRAFSHLQVSEIGGHSLLLAWEGRIPALKPVMFDAHYDVVPADPATLDEWTHPPFAGVVADGYIWGRGSVDDKAVVISTMEAIERLLEAGYTPERDLLFTLVHDEELGGAHGAARIAEQIERMGIELDFIVGEGFGFLADSPILPGRDLAMIVVAEKGYVTVSLSTRSAGGHSSMPGEDNAIVRLATAVTALHGQPFAPQLRPPVTNMLSELGAEVGGIAGFIMRQQWLSSPLLIRIMTENELTNGMIRDTTAVTMFNAGLKANVLPQRAEAKVNFRLLPGTDKQQLLRHVKSVVNDPEVEITTSDLKTAPMADIDGQGYHLIRNAIRQTDSDVVVVPFLAIGTSDKPNYAGLTPDIYGFHPYTLSASDGARVHSSDERISVASFLRAVDMSRALIVEIGAGPGTLQ